MKNLDLATCGVEEMNEVQMMEVDGGFLGPILPVMAGIFLGGFLYEVCTNPSDTASAFKEGMDARRNMSK